MVLELVDKKTQTVDDNAYEWELYEVTPEKPSSTKETVTVARMTDPQTGFRLLARNTNPQVRTEALDAWAMTNHSRNAGNSLEIVSGIYEKDIDPDKKMGEVKGYGHASVADQAQISVDFNDVPMHVPLSLFNYGELNSGQEKSTRYQEEFGENTLHAIQNYLPADINQKHLAPISEDYQKLGKLSLDLFAKNKQAVQSVFEEKYLPTKQQQRSLVSRVLDTARSHLLLGQGTGFGFKTTARDWARVVGTFKATPIPAYHALGEQLEAFLAPDKAFEQEINFLTPSPQLIKYTAQNPRIQNNLEALKTYLDESTSFNKDLETKTTFGEKNIEVTLIDPKHASPTRMAMQYVLRAHPGADGHEVMRWLDAQEDEVKKDISNLIYQEHNHHYSISQKGRTTDLGARLTGSLAEARDWNRHRAWGRFMPQIPTIESLPLTREDAQTIADEGYVLTIYLTENPELQEAKDHMVRGLEQQYDGLNKLLDDTHNEFGDDINYSFALNLLPLGHKTDMWMHGDPRQALYMTKLRVRPGGHINYRQQAWDLNQQVADSNPFLEGVRAGAEEKPDATSRQQFFDRK